MTDGYVRVPSRDDLRDYQIYRAGEDDKKRNRGRARRRDAARNRRSARAHELTDAETDKKAKFGKRAKARTPKMAKALSFITGKIVEEREVKALSQFEIDKPLREWLDAHLGFEPGAGALTAAHKGLRAYAAYAMTRRFRRFFRRNQHRFNFFFVTAIHDGWRTSDRDTHIDIKDMKIRIRNVIHQHKKRHGFELHHLGVIEFDAVTNYPAKGRGMCIMPHIHMIVWCDRDIGAEKLQEQLATSRLASEWGADSIKVSARLTEKNIVHKAYYMFEQPYKAKVLRINPKTGKQKLRTIQKHVPPHLTLRLSEILAHCSLKELIIAGGDGVAFKSGLLRSLNSFQRLAGLKKKPVDLTAAEVFRFVRASGKRGLARSSVAIRR